MRQIIVFDGVCNLCSAAVRFILNHERNHDLRFVAMQSPAGQRLLQTCSLDHIAGNSFLLIYGDKTLMKSDAAIHVAANLRMPWRLLVLSRWLPRALRDWCYDLVARNRFTWFGQRGTCMVLNEELAARFVRD